jgi:hypothetical protein
VEIAPILDLLGVAEAEEVLASLAGVFFQATPHPNESGALTGSVPR